MDISLTKAQHFGGNAHDFYRFYKISRIEIGIFPFISLIILPLLGLVISNHLSPQTLWKEALPFIGLGMGLIHLIVRFFISFTHNIEAKVHKEYGFQRFLQLEIEKECRTLYDKNNKGEEKEFIKNFLDEKLLGTWLSDELPQFKAWLDTHAKKWHVI